MKNFEKGDNIKIEYNNKTYYGIVNDSRNGEVYFNYLRYSVIHKKVIIERKVVKQNHPAISHVS